VDSVSALEDARCLETIHQELEADRAVDSEPMEISGLSTLYRSGDDSIVPYSGHPNLGGCESKKLRTIGTVLASYLSLASYSLLASYASYSLLASYSSKPLDKHSTPINRHHKQNVMTEAFIRKVYQSRMDSLDVFSVY
jgi:hypothetical protein